MKKKRKHRPHDTIDSKEICDICLDCDKPICRPDSCVRFKKEKARIIKNGKDVKK